VALGVAQARVGDDGAAIDSLSQAVDLNPKDGHTHKNLGALLSRAGKAEEALMHLRLATQLLPADPHTWYNLAGTLEEVGQLDDADEANQRAIHLDPTGALTA
jgi:Flp pilus assembly protein TadD